MSSNKLTKALERPKLHTSNKYHIICFLINQKAIDVTIRTGNLATLESRKTGFSNYLMPKNLIFPKPYYDIKPLAQSKNKIQCQRPKYQKRRRPKSSKIQTQHNLSLTLVSHQRKGTRILQII